MDIYVGNEHEKLCSNTGYLAFIEEIRVRTGKKPEFYFENDGNMCGIIKVENLPDMMRELDEIYKLKIKDYHVIKMLRHFCKIGIQKQLPIIATY